ncbi:MAG TPA: rRNA adenine dimethyltransferase family protein [Candidatus Paceibacterota bacterium]|nr:rRNA adenine dimethyltransferase family protein [Candidatus Paceibacterota bacterium]
MQKLGQHFLTDKQALEEIASLLELEKNDFIIEVGPGHGELTEQILNNESGIKNNGIIIIAIEKDEQLAGFLKKKFESNNSVEIICGDALKLLPSIIHNSSFAIHGYKLIGNIPYYITGKLLRTLGDLENKPAVSVLTIQKEVAERICAHAKKNGCNKESDDMNPTHNKFMCGMNRLAASVQFWAEPEIAMILPKSVFNPPPEVDSATIVLRPVPARKTKSSSYYKMVRAIFSQPRKTILNNLSGGLGIAKKEAGAKLSEAGIEPGLRPQNLSLENIFKLASLFKE